MFFLCDNIASEVCYCTLYIHEYAIVIHTPMEMVSKHPSQAKCVHCVDALHQICFEYLIH